VSELRKNDHVGRALSALDDALDWFHDTVLRPIILAGRALAFGFILALVGLVVAVFVLLALFRIFDVYVFGSHQWATYLAVGFLFTTGGLVTWRFRKPVPLRKS